MNQQVCLLVLALGMCAAMIPQRSAISADDEYDEVTRHAYYDGYGPVRYGRYGFGSRRSYRNGGANYTAYGNGPYGYGGGSEYLFPSVYGGTLNYTPVRSTYNLSRYGFYATDNDDW